MDQHNLYALTAKDIHSGKSHWCSRILVESGAVVAQDVQDLEYI